MGVVYRMELITMRLWQAMKQCELKECSEAKADLPPVSRLDPCPEVTQESWFTVVDLDLVFQRLI